LGRPRLECVVELTWGRPGLECVVEFIWPGSDNHSYELLRLIHCIVRPNSCNTYTVSWLGVMTLGRPRLECVVELTLGRPGLECVAAFLICPGSDNHSYELLRLIHCIVRPNSCNAYTVSWLGVMTLGRPGLECVAAFLICPDICARCAALCP
jgi:hypothetical protein